MSYQHPYVEDGRLLTGTMCDEVPSDEARRISVTMHGLLALLRSGMPAIKKHGATTPKRAKRLLAACERACKAADEATMAIGEFHERLSETHHDDHPDEDP